MSRVSRITRLDQEARELLALSRALMRPTELPAGTMFTWVAELTDRSGDFVTERFCGETYDEALATAKSYCRPGTCRFFHAMDEKWEFAVLPKAYPNQPPIERVVPWSQQKDAAE